MGAAGGLGGGAGEETEAAVERRGRPARPWYGAMTSPSQAPAGAEVTVPPAASWRRKLLVTLAALARTKSREEPRSAAKSRQGAFFF